MAHIVQLGGSATVALREIEDYLAGLPGVARDAGAYLYSDGDLGLEAELRPLGSDGKADGLEVSVADPLEPQAAEVLAGFCTSLARHFDWEVRDPANQQALSQSAVQARFGGGHLAGITPSGCVSALLLGAAVGLALRPPG